MDNISSDKSLNKNKKEKLKIHRIQVAGLSIKNESDLLNASIGSDILVLGKRQRQTLKFHKIYTIGQLITLREEDLINDQWFGIKNIEKVKVGLKSIGLYLGAIDDIDIDNKTKETLLEWRTQFLSKQKKQEVK